MTENELRDPILRQRQVLELVGVDRGTLWRWRRCGAFPNGIRVNRRGDLGWRESQVRRWLEQRERGEFLR